MRYKKYAQALITGQALAGVFTAIVNILSLIASHSASHSGVAYFICGIILLLVSLIIQLLLKKNAFARYYMELNLEYDTYQRKKLLSHEDEFSETDEEHERVPNEDSRIYRIKHIINKTWPVVLAYFFCHTITFCVFPSISSRAVSVYHQSHSKLTGPLFIPVACFVVFAVADVVGRLISRWILMPSQNQGLSLLFMSISRISLIPLFLYCNVKPRQHLPVKIYSDISYIILILLLGISHGYVGTLCAMYAPKRVQARFSESAGALAYFALIAGVATGTAISFGLIAII